MEIIIKEIIEIIIIIIHNKIFKIKNLISNITIINSLIIIVTEINFRKEEVEEEVAIFKINVKIEIIPEIKEISEIEEIPETKGIQEMEEKFAIKEVTIEIKEEIVGIKEEIAEIIEVITIEIIEEIAETKEIKGINVEGDIIYLEICNGNNNKCIKIINMKNAHQIYKKNHEGDIIMMMIRGIINNLIITVNNNSEMISKTILDFSKNHVVLREIMRTIITKIKKKNTGDNNNLVTILIKERKKKKWI